MGCGRSVSFRGGYFGLSNDDERLWILSGYGFCFFNGGFVKGFILRW